MMMKQQFVDFPFPAASAFLHPGIQLLSHIQINQTVQMAAYEGPVSLCEAWLQKRMKKLSPRSLVEISLKKIILLIKLYPTSSIEEIITV